MRLHQAIAEFLANELHMEPSAITPETTFAELNISPDAQNDLLTRMQDALGITFALDATDQITTVGEIFDAVTDQEQSQEDDES